LVGSVDGIGIGIVLGVVVVLGADAGECARAGADAGFGATAGAGAIAGSMLAIDGPVLTTALWRCGYLAINRIPLATSTAC
jgi:hypothetical protein